MGAPRGNEPYDSGMEIMVLEGEDKGKVFPLSFKEIQIGRQLVPDERKPGWILMDDSTVSRLHGVLRWSDTTGKYVIHHESKTNPTRVNNRIVQEAVLTPGDVVRMGDLVFLIKTVERDLSQSAIEKAQVPLVEPEEKVSTGFKLLVVEGPDQGASFPLDHTLVHIGKYEPEGPSRPAGCISLKDDELAREQALLAWNPGEKKYAIFQSEEAASPTKISRIPSISEKQEDDIEKRNLLGHDDMIIMGNTVLLVMREEKMFETWGAAMDSLKLSKDDLSATKNRDIYLLSQLEQEKEKEKEPQPPPQPAALPIAEQGRPDFGDMTTPWSFKSDYILEIIEGSDLGMRINLMAGTMMEERTLTFGARGKRQNDIQIDDDKVENEQGVLKFQGGKFSILNQGQKTTFLVNDAPLKAGAKTALCNGDEIKVGETVLLFIDRRSMEKQFQYQVDVTQSNSGDEGKKFVPNKEVMVIGRGQGCDIQLSDREISREHAALIFRQARYFVEHRSEMNPTFVNGVSVPKGRHKMLSHGDLIQLSEHTVLEFKKIKTLSMKGKKS